jgi:hypothetical protein
MNYEKWKNKQTLRKLLQKIENCCCSILWPRYIVTLHPFQILYKVDVLKVWAEPENDTSLGSNYKLIWNMKLRFSVRVARWYIFKQKIQIWVNFGGSCNWRCWYISCSFGRSSDIWYTYIFYGHLVCFLVIFPRLGML